MEPLNKLQHFIILLIIFVFPIFFLPITQEFYVIQKMFLVVYGTLALIALSSLRRILERRIEIVKSPFTKVLIAFVGIRAVSILLSSPNKIQALYSLPTGLLPLTALVVFYLLIVNSSAHIRKEIPLFQALISGGVVAALVAIFGAVNPLQNISLPPFAEFLHVPHFSTLGSQFETVVFLGFLCVLLIADACSSFIQKREDFAQSTLMACVIGAAVVIVGYQLFSQPTPHLPPLQPSWVATVETLKSPKSALFGNGVDTFDSLFSLTKPLSYNLTSQWQVNYNVSRSALLHIWAESGLLGLIAILALSVYVIREIHGLLLHKDDQAYVFATSGICLGLILIAFPASYSMFFISAVYLAALTLASHTYERAPSRVIDSSIATILLSLCSLVCVVIVGYFAGRVYASEVHFKKSIDAIRRNDGNSVYTELQSAIKLYPENEKYRSQFSQINLLLANDYARQKDLTDQDRRAMSQFVQQAIAEAKAGVALNPERATNWNNLAAIYKSIIPIAKGADSWAIAAYQQAIMRDPRNPLLRFNLAGVYFGQNAFDDAVVHYEQAVALKPDWANARYNLAWALYRQDKVADSITMLHSVLQLIDAHSKDYSTAMATLDTFKATKEIEASPTGALNPPDSASSALPQDPLALPATVSAQLSPQIELPQESHLESNTTPTPTPTKTQ